MTITEVKLCPLLIIKKERKKESGVTQSCPILCDFMDCSLPGSSVNGILQARILEQVAIYFSSCSSYQELNDTYLSDYC